MLSAPFYFLFVEIWKSTSSIFYAFYVHNVLENHPAHLGRPNLVFLRVPQLNKTSTPFCHVIIFRISTFFAEIKLTGHNFRHLISANELNARAFGKLSHCIELTFIGSPDLFGIGIVPESRDAVTDLRLWFHTTPSSGSHWWCSPTEACWPVCSQRSRVTRGAAEHTEHKTHVTANPATKTRSRRDPACRCVGLDCDD